jgi:hypothetical protein
MSKPATRVAKVSEYGLASMLQSGTAFTHLVNLSMAVNRSMWPSEEASRGPTRSMCMWRICLPAQGCCGMELLAVCRPFSIGTVGRFGTWLPFHCPHPPRHSMEIPSVGSSYASVCHTVDSVEDYSPVLSQWLTACQPLGQWPEDAMCHITQQPPLPGQSSLPGRKT